MRSDLATIFLSMRVKAGDGLLPLLGRYAMRIVYLIPLIFLWRGLFARGVPSDISLAQMLSYTLASAIFGDLVNVRTPATEWGFDGLLFDMLRRPAGLFRQLAAMTAGTWIPTLCFFSLPLAAAASLLGVALIPASGWFAVSLLLATALGFAMDFLFACVILALHEEYLLSVIRGAVTALFSGAVIPFALLPWGIGDVLKHTPFGSLAGAPLSLFAGIEGPLAVIPAQIAWNLLLWPLAGWCFRRSRGRMVSHGG